MQRVSLHSYFVIVLPFCTRTLLIGADTTSLTGHITDPQGASVVGAIVTLYDRDNATRIRVTSDLTGAYRFERVRAGEYLLEVDSPGLAQPSVLTVNLELGQQTVRDVALGMAGHHDEVVVTALGRLNLWTRFPRQLPLLTSETLRNGMNIRFPKHCELCQVCEFNNWVVQEFSRVSRSGGCATRIQPCSSMGSVFEMRLQRRVTPPGSVVRIVKVPTGLLRDCLRFYYGGAKGDLRR